MQNIMYQLSKGGALALLLGWGTAGRAQNVGGPDIPLYPSSWLQSMQFMSTEEYDRFRRLNREDAEHQRLEKLALLAPEVTFFTPEWWAGRILLADGRAIKASQTRYNIGLRVVEIRDSVTQAIEILPARTIRNFALRKPASWQQYLFEVHKYEANNGGYGSHFFQPINDKGRLRLYLLNEIVENEAVQVAAMNVEVWPSKIVRATRLFAGQADDKTLHELTLNRSSVLRLFRKHAKEVADYAATKHYSYENLDDVIKLTEYYNTVLEKS